VQEAGARGKCIKYLARIWIK